MEFHATGLQVRGLATALKPVLIHHLLQKKGPSQKFKRCYSFV